MADTAAQEIRDDLIAQDVRYRRVDASVRREVNARLDQLGRDLKVLMIDIDPWGTKRRDARKRRHKKLKEESRILIRTAYSEINGIMRGTLRRVSKVESATTAKIVRSNVP